MQFASMTLGLDATVIDDKENFQKRLLATRATELKAMKLNSQFMNQTNDIKVEESWEWLSKGDLKKETESLLMAVSHKHQQSKERNIQN